MNATLGILGWITQSMAYLAELVVYAVRAVWNTIITATIGFLEVVDDLLPDLGILDNALWRGLITGAVGFFVGVGLMIFLSFITGNWGIPCVFVLTIGFCAFVGFAADPDGDWSLGAPPSFGRGPGPQTPLNL